jgi:uncharacterized protein YvpB
MKLLVPYYSQFADVEDRYWMPRACLPSCLKMVLDYHNKTNTPSINDLIKKGEADGGYGKSGWFHDSIVNLAKEYGLDAHREENILGIESLKNSLDKNNPIIVSVTKFILGQTKFHTIVLTGYEEVGGEVSGFYFHDPESTSIERHRESQFVNIETFNKEWRKMAIFIG